MRRFSFKFLYVCPFDNTAVAGSWKVWPVNQVNDTRLVAVATPADRRKSVRNRLVIELFCGVFCVVTLPFWYFCWCRGLLSYDWVRSLPFSSAVNVPGSNQKHFRTSSSISNFTFAQKLHYMFNFSLRNSKISNAGMLSTNYDKILGLIGRIMLKQHPNDSAYDETIFTNSFLNRCMWF